MSESWKFSKIPCIEESAFDKTLEQFYNFGVSGLIRENIQNSLDAKIPENSKPVVITIETGTINRNLLPGIDEIIDRVNNLVGKNSYTKETIEQMKYKMNNEVINYLSIEDYNTKGLKGAHNGHSNNPEDTWGIYAYNKGFHTQEGDESIESLKGGSHGIGKIASNAASDLNIMYFANCDEDGNKHLGGSVHLIEHKYNDYYYRATGYFTDIVNIDEHTTKFYPYKNTFNEIFEKNTRGLKIIIPYLRNQFNDEDMIIKSVCDSFFVAILEEKIVVIINDKRLDKNTIERYIFDEKYYTQEIKDINEDFTPLYFYTYKNCKPILINIKDLYKNYAFNLYFNYDLNITNGRLGIIRTIGMKIEDRKIPQNLKRPFNAILIPASTTEDAFLKSLENYSHTMLSYTHFKNPLLQKNAKIFIRNMIYQISSIIQDTIFENNKTDGMIDTNDILYEVYIQFKQELFQSMPLITLKNSELNKSKIIIKIDQQEDLANTNNNLIKIIDKNKQDKKSTKKEKYLISPLIINRVVLGEVEYLEFDFREIKKLNSVTQCNISNGNIKDISNDNEDMLNINDNYFEIKDMNNNQSLTIENNIIKNISIISGFVRLELKRNMNYDNNLNYIYYMEV